MKAWWQLFPKHFTPAECTALVEYGLTHPERTGTVGHGGGKSIVNTDLRRSKVRWLNRHDPQLFNLFARISDLAEMANANGFGFDLRGFKEVQFTQYSAGDSGHYGWHEDNCWKHGFGDERKMSMVIQLCPPNLYEGGKLELANDPLPPGSFENQGDVIFFPSFNRHRVTPVTRGTRFSLVTWFNGPAFR